MLVGYARVSTTDQTPQAQLDALEAVDCERIFQEHASGAKADRPQLAAALDYMRDGDTLVVWKLDRLARSMSQLIETASMLEARSIGLHSLTEAVDTTTAGGKLVFHIFGALAEFERSLIRERTKAGLDAARARGRKGGRPAKLTADNLQTVKVLLADDMPVTRIAKQLGVAPNTIYRTGLVPKVADNNAG